MLIFYMVLEFTYLTGSLRALAIVSYSVGNGEGLNVAFSLNDVFAS